MQFLCDCGYENYISYDLNCGDSLNHNCPSCGKYYKKAARIRDDQIQDDTIHQVCKHCICADDGKELCCYCRSVN